MAVLLIATLDTKGDEAGYVRDQLTAAGVPVVTLDAGVVGPPPFPPDIARDAVFAAAGTSYERVKARADRGEAVRLAALGAAKIAADLHAGGGLSGVLSLGGSAGTTIGTAAMRALPIGVPKLMVSTLASGQVQPYVGTRDVIMMYPVVDLAGLNRVSCSVLDNAAAAMAGMYRLQAGRLHANAGGGSHTTGARGRPLVAATMFGVTTPCVEVARKVIEAAGYEVLVFHATGTGGRTMEDLVRDGLIAGVLDITTTELADERLGGILSAGPDRLTGAANQGIPQVVSVGALDMVNFGPPTTLPDRYRGRLVYAHNPNVTLMRTTPPEMAEIGEELARKVNTAAGPTAVMIPVQGVSAIDAAGKPFWWPEADTALLGAVRKTLRDGIELIEVDRHINDPEFATACARKLLDLMANHETGPAGTPR